MELLFKQVSDSSVLLKTCCTVHRSQPLWDPEEVKSPHPHLRLPGTQSGDQVPGTEPLMVPHFSKGWGGGVGVMRYFCKMLMQNHTTTQECSTNTDARRGSRLKDGVLKVPDMTSARDQTGRDLPGNTTAARAEKGSEL